MTLVRRRDLSRNLNAAEGDGNIDDLDGRLVDLETNPPTANNIDDISMNGNQMTITLTDYSTFIVTVPTSNWNSRGRFADGQTYLVNDVFTAKGNLYVVLFAHLSVAPFDPGANDGLGHDYYAIALPNFGVPTTTNRTGTTITLVTDDENRYIRCLAATAVTVELTEANLLLMSDDFEVQLRQCTELGTLSFSIEGTITANLRSDRMAVTAIGGAVVLLKRVGTLEVDLIGDLAPSDS